MTPAGAGERGACCSFKGLSDIVSPISGGGEPQICSGCAGNTRSGRARYLSVAAKDAKKNQRGFVFTPVMKLFSASRGNGGSAAARNIIPRGQKANFIL